MIFTNGKVKTGIYNQLNTLVVATPLIAIEKVKTAKNILNKKAFVAGNLAAGTVTPTLQFL